MKRWKLLVPFLAASLAGCGKSAEDVAAARKYCETNDMQLQKQVDTRSNMVIGVRCIDKDGIAYPVNLNAK